MTSAHWIELGFLPVDVGYAATEKAWHAALAECDLPDEPFPLQDGHCVHWTRKGSNDVVIITIGKCGDRTISQVVALIAHECMHAWRHIREAIGEKEPSAEFEAYVVQTLVQGCVVAHRNGRRKPWKQ